MSFMRYKDGMGYEYEVPLDRVPEFDRRRRNLLVIAIIVQMVMMVLLLWMAWK